MVVSRPNRVKSMSNHLSEPMVDKYHRTDLIEPITVVLSSSSDDDETITIADNPIVIMISDDEQAVDDQFVPDRPRRNIIRTNYNQSKMMKKFYAQSGTYRKSENGFKEKRKDKENMKMSEKGVGKMLKRKAIEAGEESEPEPPKNAVDINQLLNNVPVILKSKTRHSKAVAGAGEDENLDPICFSFRYPWELRTEPKSSVAVSSQVFGFRTLENGSSETLFWQK